MPFPPCARSFSRLQLSGARLFIALLASTALVAQPLAGGVAFAGDALPTGGQVVSGSVSIGASGPAMTVTQGSDKAIVNWNGFSVGQGNSVNFIQPNSASAILNRVTGSTTSTIAGSITGNGQVYLINPNGIAITSTGSVAVSGGFVASTLDMSNEDFLKGQYNFTGNGSSGSVTNEGVITLGRGGYAALIGGTVKNDGLIAVPLGKVGLGSGEQATLDLSGDGFLQVAIPTKTGAEGNGALVENSGTISADGGTVVMKAATARNAARHAVNLSGSVEADSISGSDGEIVIGGGEGGHVTVSGKLSAKSSTGKGGKVTISGKSIALKGATVDASGAKGGGTVKIGGDYQGKGTTQRAETTSIDAQSTIKANATESGNGGNIVVWSDNLTTFAGLITAMGADTGAGGDAEVSGKAVLNYAGLTNLSGPGGFGTLLLDPYNLTISSAPSSGMSGFSASGNDSVLNVTTLTSALASANVTVTTGSSGSQTGNITVATPISWSANTTLTLNAAGSVFINHNISASGTSAGLTLAYGTGYSLNNGARVTLSGTSASLSLGGTSYTLIHDLTGLQSMSGSGNYALGNDIDASATASWNSGAGFDPINGFTGTFTGLGHFVDSLTINRPSAATVGLFGLTSGSIRDITLSNASITGSGTVGSIAARLSAGSLTNVHVTGNVTGQGSEIGGLVGWSDQGTISLSSAAVNVSGVSEVGGLVGRNRAANIAYSYSTGNVTGTGSAIGGLIGSTVQGTALTDVYASGSVTGGSETGGLIGTQDSTAINLTDAYWDASATGQSFAIGFISGSPVNSGTATNVAAAPRTQSTYTGFDFTNTWVMIAGETRPMLRNEYSTVIATPTALQLMSLDLSASYTLGANINMTSALAAGGNGYYGGLWGASGFSPVGTNSSGFTGSFNGQGHTITGLTISRASTNYVGLFGYTNGANISNVTLSGGSITGNDGVGPLIGYMMGGSVSLASASASVSGTSSGEVNTGGLIGTVDSGSVSNSFASGTVTGVGWDVGGLVGYLTNGGTITQSYATGNVTGTGTSTGNGYVGGLVGANGYTGDGGTISQSYATGTITGAMGPIGGLVGHNEGTITDSYATGRVIGLSGASNIGGFVGVNFVNGTITNAYSTGYVTGTVNIGGFAGYNNNSAAAITNAYWDTQTSGQSTGIFGGSGGVTARTTAQLQGSLPPGFSYSIWSTGTNLYPYFSWQYSTTPVVVSGIAYSDSGTTALSGATVTAVAAGTAIGSAVTGDNGYYYILLAPGSSIASTGVLTYLDNGTIKGAAFSDVAGTNGVQHASIYGSAVNVLTGQATLTATRSNYLSTLGSYSDTDLSFLSSSSFAPLTTTSGFGVYLNTSGSYLINANLGSSGLLNINSGGTFGVSGALALSAAGTLTIADAVSWTDASSLTLSTTNSGNISLGGAVTGTAGTLIVNAGGTATTASAIDVGTFRLTGGTWNQIAASLPTFNAASFTLGSGTTFLRATGGDGSVATPYEIADLYGLQGIASTSLLSQNFALVANINAAGTSNWNSGAGFASIGSSGTSFTGSFDGRGHSITGLVVNRPTLSAGLFGTIGSNGSVSDLSVAGIVTGLNAGILAGANAGTVSGIATSGTVNNTGAATSGDMGGLVGQNTGTISNSASSASVSASSISGSNVGGLAGSNSSSGTISGSYASGSVTNAGATGGSAGGLAGSSAGSISNAFATGAVTSGYYSGGLVGLNNGGTVSNTYATGSVSGEYAGGLVGRSSGTITNTYATGSASGNQYSGGLVGYNDTSGAISGSFWNTTTSGNSIGVGAGLMSGTVGMTTSQLSNLSAFTSAGWSIDGAGGTASVWRIYEGYTAPLLRSFMTSLTVTGTSATKTYDGSAISSDTGTLTYSNASYDTSLINGTAIYTASSANVGTYSGSNLTLSGLYSGQQGYDITFISGSLTVNAKAITVTADAKSTLYGDSTPALTYQITSGSLVNGDSLTGALATNATATSNVGSYAIIQNSLGNSNYAITYLGANVSVGAATLTVTAANGSMPFGAAVPALGYTVTGWKNGQSDSLLSGVVVGTNATSSSPAGTGYITTASGGSLLSPASGNYVLNYVNGTFSVTGQAIPNPTPGASAGVLLDPSNVPAFPLHSPQTVDYRWSKTDNEKRSTQSADGSIMSVEHLATSCTVQSSMSGPCSLN